MEEKTSFSAQNKEWRKKVFRDLLEEWKKTTFPKEHFRKGRDEDFAKKIYASRSTISNYKRGDIPDGKIDELAREFGVDSSVFFPDRHSETYLLDSVYVDKVGRKHYKYADEIGLKRSFIRFLHEGTNMDKEFPLYSPIDCVIGLHEDTYKRRSPDCFVNSAKMTDNPDMQINKGKKKVILSYADLQFMKELQDEVSKYIRFLYQKRVQEMNEEVEECNRYQPEKDKDGWRHFPLTTKEMREIDRFRQYVYWNDQEAEEYGNDPEEE